MEDSKLTEHIDSQMKDILMKQHSQIKSKVINLIETDL